MLDYLNEIGVSLLSLANNHSWDYGDEGIVSTVAEASKRGFTYAGTGGTMAEAVAPAYRHVGAVRVGLVALATVSSLEGAEATEISAGVNMLEPDDDAAWDRNIAAIEEAAANADFVITYQHYQVDAGPGWQEQWAHAAVDAGADLYVSHGEPQLAGVEEYRGGLILHGLGNFIFHSRTEIGNYPPEVWESAVVSLSLGTDGVREATFTPVTLDEGTPGDLFFETRGYPEVAAGDAAEGILARLARMSAAYGTTLELRDGQAHWRAERPGGALRTAADFIETVEGVQDPDSDGLEGHTIESMMDELGVPGVSVAVIRDFDIHWAKGYGVADVETGAAVDTQTLFQAASISKPVAAMAVLRTVQDGSFSMDEDINGILTSWQLDGGEFTRDHPVTPRMLTSHTSGLGDGFGFPGYDPDDPLPTTVQILNGEEPSNVGDVFMERAPMTAMKYSGGGVTVMQLALSDALGRPFGDILQEYVLDPVGMEHSTFEQPLPPDRDLNATRGHDQERPGQTTEVARLPRVGGCRPVDHTDRSGPLRDRGAEDGAGRPGPGAHAVVGRRDAESRGGRSLRRRLRNRAGGRGLVLQPHGGKLGLPGAPQGPPRQGLRRRRDDECGPGRGSDGGDPVHGWRRLTGGTRWTSRCLAEVGRRSALRSVAGAGRRCG